MKIAFLGKGGSGKSTMAALFASYLKREGAPCLLIDADLNQHLARYLGLDVSKGASLVERQGSIKTWLAGDNPRVRPGQMIKTTPPGTGSGLVTFATLPAALEDACSHADGLFFARLGPCVDEESLGVRCYHGKLGIVELLLGHMREEKEEYVLVDMTAGADALSSSIFTRFDLLLFVVEPTLSSLDVLQQYLPFLQDWSIPYGVIANKVTSEEDVAFLRQHLPVEPVITVSWATEVRALSQGRAGGMSRETLTTLHTYIDSQPQEPERLLRHGILMHRRNAVAWANAAMGADLETQIDPDFL